MCRCGHRYVDLGLVGHGWSIAHLLCRCRGLLFLPVKLSVWSAGLQHTARTQGTNETLSLDRQMQVIIRPIDMGHL